MINISTRNVPDTLLGHPDLKRQVDRHFSRFNSPWFDRAQRSIICLHEATHVVYARMLGFNPRLYGPSVDFDPDSEKFRRLDASVESLPYEIGMDADPVLIAKYHMGPAYVEAKLLSHRTWEEIWADAQGDLAICNKWAVERERVRGDYLLSVAKTKTFLRDEVYRDCRSPAFRRKLWEAAREFEARVFS